LQGCGTGEAAGKSYVTSFASSATFSCHELWLANVHTRSQRCKKHLQVCDAIATLLKNKSLTSSNKFIYIVTPVTISAEHKHTLFAQQRLTTSDTERFTTALRQEPQDHRHFLITILFANSKHLVIILHLIPCSQCRICL